MTTFNEIAPGGVGAPAEGVNLTTARGRKFVSTVTPSADAPEPKLSDIALMLDTCVNMADLARGDISRLMPRLPATTSLWVHVDLVRAIGHLRKVSVLLDKITDQLDGDGHQAAVDAADDDWADPAWQVDSTVYPCCMSIGSHAPDCQLSDDTNTARLR